ncbi:hypothetical protein Tco_0713543 [Tanacetum coccineum]
MPETTNPSQSNLQLTLRAVLVAQQFEDPQLVDWNVFEEYECKDELRDLMKIEYIHEDGDVFIDRSWENVFSNGEKVYPEWCLELYSTIYFKRKVNQDEIMMEKCIWFRLCGKDHVYTLPKFAVLLGLYTYWNMIGTPMIGKKKMAKLRYSVLHILHKMLVGAFVHKTESRDKVQKPDLWLLSLLDDGHNANVAWILAEYLSRRASGIKEKSEICRGHFVTKIAKKLGFYNEGELAKCSEPIKSESWDDTMFGKAFNRKTTKLSLIISLKAPPQTRNLPRIKPSGLDSSWGDWNASLNDIKRRDILRDTMLMRNGILDYTVLILHHLADEADYTIPTAFDPPNVPPYPYPYVRYPYPHTHYPDMVNPSYGGGEYGAPRDAYLFIGVMPSYGGNSIVSSSDYEVGGSSRRVQDDDDDMSDQLVHTDDCVASGDDMDD